MSPLLLSTVCRDTTPEFCEPVNVDCASLFAGTRYPSEALDGASRLRLIEADRATIAGSNAADSWAKRGSQAHDLSPGELDDFKQGEDEYTSLAIGLISVLLAWSPFEEQYKNSERPSQVKAPKPKSLHDPVPHGSGFR
eukprot:567433-Pyramimonas_sp.AAC.1